MSNQRVTIEDNRGKGGIEMILGILAAIIVGFVVCGLAPGIFLTSIIDWFIGLEPKTSWGFSIVNTILVYILCRKYSSHFTDLGSTISYAIIAVSTAFLIFLSALFFDYPFPQRTLIRMFGKSVKAEYATSIGEKRIIREETQKYLTMQIENETQEIKKKLSELSDLKNNNPLDLNKYQIEELQEKIKTENQNLEYKKAELDSLNRGFDIQNQGYHFFSER